MLSKQIDEYIAGYIEGNPSWQVILSNGEIIYQDDGRYKPHSAWIRLRRYCYDNNLYIVSMNIGFRDNRYGLPPKADGYYFSLGARGVLGHNKTLALFFAGALQNGILEVSLWRVPEMILEYTERRNPSEAGECLILKDTNQYTI